MSINQKLLISLACALSIAFVACRSYTLLPLSMRQELQSNMSHKTVALKISCYYGSLYDDNDHFLLSERPFEHTSHIIDLDGNPISPGKADGIIPAGTSFEIITIEFPDKKAQLRRMLRTPRYNPWIIMKLKNNNDPFLPAANKTFVLVLPREMDSEKKFREALNAFLGEPKKVKTWLKKRSEAIQVAIAHKEVKAGMSYAELIASRGYPWFVKSHKEKELETTEADYGYACVWLKDNQVEQEMPMACDPEAIPKALRAGQVFDAQTE